MIFYAVVFLVGSLIYMYLGYSNLWIAAMLIVANTYACGSMIVKELKK